MRRANTSLCAVIAFAMGCGGASPPPPTAASEESFEETGSMAALPEGVEAPELPARAIGTGEHPDVTGLLRARAADAPPPDMRELYRQLAPATVIVRSTNSMGTGVVVGPHGLILTNNHVIASAELRDFQMHVTVEYGQMGETGAMEPEGRQRPGLVLAVDEERDLALVRVQEPVEDAPLVAIAAEDPLPGTAVITIGHGNVGMVWAVRRCDIEATGRFEETYSRLQAVCGGEQEVSQRMCQRMRERFHERSRGLLIQSSCVLAPGDSGGPLVDTRGNLVGLNVMTVRNEQNQWSNFHIHVHEVRDFVSRVPDAPLVSLPDPWVSHPALQTVSDNDLDGRWDTIEAIGPNRVRARLYDLDQDTPDFAQEDIGRLLREREFDAELAIVSRQHTTYVWYDTDGDRELDLLMTLDSAHRAVAAYNVRGDVITATPAPQGDAIAASRVPPEGRSRFAHILGESARSGDPSPLPGVLRRARLRDYTRDGIPDTLQADFGLVHAVTFDVDQSSMNGLAPDGVEELVRSGALDAEVSLVRRGPILWGYYDRDDDGQMEFGVRTAPFSSVVAATVAVEGRPSAIQAVDVIGTLLIRTDLMGARADAFERMALRSADSSWVATGSAHGGLPDPLHHHHAARVRASYTEHGWENAVVSLESHGFATTLVDVDRDSFRGRGRRHLSDGLEAALRAEHFSAEFALSSARGAVWAWYDTDHDGTWDIVLVRVTDGAMPRTNAFRRDGESFAHAADLMEGRLVRPSLLPRRHRRRFAELARAIFDPREVEE